MPPGKKKQESILDRVHKESAERNKLIREEFDRIERDLKERYHLDDANERIKGLQSVMNAKLRVLRNRICNETDIITGEYVNAVRDAEKEGGRGKRSKGGHERPEGGSGPNPSIKKGNGGKAEARKEGVSQDSERTVSQITSKATRNRARINKSPSEVQNRNIQNASDSAAGLAPVSTAAPDAGTAIVSGANEAPNASAGPSTTCLVGSVVDCVVGSAVDSVGGSATPTVARSATRSLAGSVVDSGAGPMDLSDAPKPDSNKLGYAVDVVSHEPPRAIEKVIKAGHRTIKIKGPAPPSSHGTHDSAIHEPTMKDDEIGKDNSSREHKKGRKTKKKSKAKKKKTLFNEIFESDQSGEPAENNDSGNVGGNKNKSSRKEEKSVSIPSEVVEVEPKDDEDVAVAGIKTKSKAVKENKPTSDDVVEVVSVVEDVEPTPDDMQNIDGEKEVQEVISTAKHTTVGGKKTSPTAEEPRPTEIEQRAQEPAPRRSTRNRKPSQRKLEADANQRGAPRR